MDKQLLIDKLNQNTELKKFGGKKELLHYFDEEWEELILHNRPDILVKVSHSHLVIVYDRQQAALFSFFSLGPCVTAAPSQTHG